MYIIAVKLWVICYKIFQFLACTFTLSFNETVFLVLMQSDVLDL